ncbi:hypothetical protein AMJ83_10710 [candidate division WOR_3 bacterium SM23_42]|uniref:PatA-like N-terminal domain-containing protein n=1 Tax=candidate division WOR_3 bacterium SM23_42 TaxID=1703779 RepID=A0A0S8FQD0_UNCW3|nr:MAG: hypothetical protein AMJ83_10710 [candidate division WOR_3 bacterium SM23_42]
MTFEINLHDFNLTDVLQFVLNTKKTGVVHVEGGTAGEIYFANGLVVHAAAAACEGVDALFEMSCTTSGKAKFEPRVEAPKQTVSEDTGKLVETIEKRRIEFETIKQDLPPMDSVWAKTTREPESAVALRRTDWQVLAMLDGKRTLSGVITESKLGGFEAMKTIVWLKEKGLICEPGHAARVVSRVINYLNFFFADFSKNGLIWYKRWLATTEGNEKIAGAITIDEETMEANVVSELTSKQIDDFIGSFEAIVKTEGPKIYGKLLFRKKFEDFQAKLKEQD